MDGTVLAPWLQSLFQCIPGLYLVLDPAFTIIAVSEKYAKALQSRPDELLGNNLLELMRVSPGFGAVDGLEASLRRGLDGQIVCVEEETWQQPDGTIHWARYEVRPWRDSAGNIGGIVVCVEDITERKRAEQLVRESREFVPAILASLSAHIAVLDRNCQIVTVNPAWNQFALENGGASDKCGPGANYLQVRHGAASDDELAQRVAAGLQDILDGKSSEFTLEYPCHSPDQQRWFLMQATPLRTSRGGIVVSHTNITARVLAEQALREQQQRLAAILNTAADAIITLDRSGIIQSVNPATERMFGYEAAEMVGQNIHLLLHTPSPPNGDSVLQRYLQSGDKSLVASGLEMQGRRKDGNIIPIEVTLSESSPGQQFTGIFRDLTRRRELEYEVVEIASLEQRRIGQDLHDTIGQELTALELLAGDLLDTLQSSPTLIPQLIGRIISGLSRCKTALRAVIRGLLPVPIDNLGLMAALADLAERATQESKIDCTFEYDRPIVVADNSTATHLYLIAQEAVHNAIKHAHPRRIRIRLEANELLSLCVEDDGIGMQDTITNPGLGLRIMRNRAAILGATLEFEPAKPTGTRITCTLRRMYHEQPVNQPGRPDSHR